MKSLHIDCSNFIEANTKAVKEIQLQLFISYDQKATFFLKAPFKFKDYSVHVHIKDSFFYFTNSLNDKNAGEKNFNFAIFSDIFEIKSSIKFFFAKHNKDSILLCDFSIEKNNVIFLAESLDFQVYRGFFNNNRGLFNNKIEINTNLVFKNMLAYSSTHLKFKKILNIFGGSLNETIPIPPNANQQRIYSHIAKNDHDSRIYVESGNILLNSIFNIYSLFSDLSFDKKIDILDWGVGCGRLARHIPINIVNKFCGIDIDPINIAWCNKNMPFGEYKVVMPYEESDIFDTKFDLIYSFSVMTHLIEEDQIFWLKKLLNLCKPDGIIILSVHDLVNSLKYDWTSHPETMNNFLASGMKGGGQNPDIADISPPNYYSDTANTPLHIYSKWGELCNLLDIIPKGLGDHAAVVITHKK